jgi:Class II flagellar assembly regulator
MRVAAATPLNAAAPASSARRTGPGGFSVAGADAPHAAPPSAGPRAVAGIEALLALQAVDEPQERRRRAVRRGRTALDVLDELKLGLLAGTLDTAALRKLVTIVGALAEGSGDARLDAVLSAIELRAAVELAKFAPAVGPAGLG